MSTTTESIPQTWDDERDGRFFRITAALFGADFCYGAGVLLASYDDDAFAHHANRAGTSSALCDDAAGDAGDRASTDPSSYAA